MQEISKSCHAECDLQIDDLWVRRDRMGLWKLEAGGNLRVI